MCMNSISTTAQTSSLDDGETNSHKTHNHTTHATPPSHHIHDTGCITTITATTHLQHHIHKLPLARTF
eukprot:m.115128 g.115128  ORF g.115128 m.115128 type:complete len:68 (+) comp16043_c0_seq2:5205-5408(+)